MEMLAMTNDDDQLIRPSFPSSNAGEEGFNLQVLLLFFFFCFYAVFIFHRFPDTLSLSRMHGIFAVAFLPGGVLAGNSRNASEHQESEDNDQRKSTIQVSRSL